MTSITTPCSTTPASASSASTRLSTGARARKHSNLPGRLLRSAGGAGLLVLLAACGSATSATTAGNASASASTTGSTTGSAAGAAPTSSGTSSTDANATGSATTTAGGANGAAVQAYRDCLTQHGVTLPTRPTTPPGVTTVAGQARVPGGGGGGGGGGLQSVIADPANKAAVDACQALMPAGGFGQGANNPARSQAFQAYYSCLSDNGVVVPTTVAGGPPPSLDQSAPAFAAANQKCQALLPQRGGNTSTTTTVAG